MQNSPYLYTTNQLINKNMKRLTVKQIEQRQKAYGFDKMQEMINTGQAWKMEGSVGREAMRLLESGACMLPKEFKTDYYGNRVPSRDVLQAGTKGTLRNCQDFWAGVDDGSIEIDEFAEMD